MLGQDFPEKSFGLVEFSRLDQRCDASNLLRILVRWQRYSEKRKYREKNQAASGYVPSRGPSS
jgi:hypothetical protein